MADTKNKPLCFVLSPIGVAGSAIRRRADGVLNEIIRPALEDKYSVRRADDYGEPGIFTEKIVEAIRKAELAVADLTEANPNVMYELALRHIVRKPIIQMIEYDQTIPSDIGSVDTIQFYSDLAGRADAVKKVRDQANLIGTGRDFGNPIVRAIQIGALDQIGTDIGSALAAILRATQTLDGRLGAIEQQKQPPAAPQMAAANLQGLGRALLNITWKDLEGHPENYAHIGAPVARRCSLCQAEIWGMAKLSSASGLPVCDTCAGGTPTTPRSA